MVRFSSSLDDKQPQKRNNQVPEGFDLEYSGLTQREVSQRPVYTQEAPQYVERQPQVIEYDDYDNISLDEKPQINEPLQFHPKDNIQFGVEYSPNSKPPVIGNNYMIRSNSIIYNDVVKIGRAHV